MALDTEQKRRAAMAAGMPFVVLTPVADGTIDSADRALLADVYSGLDLSGDIIVADTGDIVYGMTKIIRTIKTILEPYGSMYEV